MLTDLNHMLTRRWKYYNIAPELEEFDSEFEESKHKYEVNIITLTLLPTFEVGDARQMLPVLNKGYAKLFMTLTMLRLNT